MKLALMKCTHDLNILGRNEDGTIDKCFFKGKEYYFCVTKKNGKQEIFTFNEVNEFHVMKLEDDFTSLFFQTIKVDDAENFDLDEFTLNRYKKIAKQKRNYQG